MPPPVYFLSDAHLGAEPPAVEAVKERDLIEWLDGLEPDATLYLLGDVFDFWFDFGGDPPDSHLPVLGALQRATDRGLTVAFMGGNHDYWARTGRGPGWLEREVGLTLVPDPHVALHHGLRLLLTHGDALGGAAGGYRVVRTVLRSRLAIAGFRLLPAHLGRAIARRTSATSRSRHHEEALAAHRARLAAAAEAIIENGEVDAVIAGHVHHPERRETERGVYLNLGDWMAHRTFGRLADGRLDLVHWDPDR
ncbi:MAG TPA: UDP-2,3-diacylglucosamine diphosphatase [Gemmatimonadota bacterium]|nr:UDP-2,3-diacylglucosamine diphosphatase [Gemmatimonadota bacterium]